MSYRKTTFVCSLCVALTLTISSSFAEDKVIEKAVVQKEAVEPEYIAIIPTVIISDDEFEDEFEDDYAEDSSDESDPLESYNRIAYDFNDVLDRFLLTPIARGYRKVVPEYGRDRIGNALSNLTSPVSLVNNILQGDVKGTMTVFWRFVVNSTIGIGGLHDIAADFGLKEDDADFGQTMGVYGLESGPYIVLPILGPTTLRDGLGDIFDIIYNPTSYVGTSFAIGYRTAEIIDDREAILDLTDDIAKNSFDPYTSIKSSYLQYRQEKINSAYK